MGRTLFNSSIKPLLKEIKLSDRAIFYDVDDILNVCDMIRDGASQTCEKGETKCQDSSLEKEKTRQCFT